MVGRGSLMNWMWTKTEKLEHFIAHRADNVLATTWRYSDRLTTDRPDHHPPGLQRSLPLTTVYISFSQHRLSWHSRNAAFYVLHKQPSSSVFFNFPLHHHELAQKQQRHPFLPQQYTHQSPETSAGSGTSATRVAIKAQQLYEIHRIPPGQLCVFVVMTRAYVLGGWPNVTKANKVAGEWRSEQQEMAEKLRFHGLLDWRLYRSVMFFIKSLKYSSTRDDRYFPWTVGYLV